MKPTLLAAAALCAAAWFPLRLAADAAGPAAAQPGIPAANPYAPAFAAVARLDRADREALSQGRPLSAAGRALAAEVGRTLAAARQAAAVDWGVDYARLGPAGAPAYLNGATTLAQLALATDGPPDAATLTDRALATLTLARHLGRDGLLVSWMLQQSLEARTGAWLEQHRASLAPADARQLLAALKTLPAGGDLPTALTVEKAVFLDRLADEIQQIYAQAGATAAATATGAAADLRLAGLLTAGPISAISLEQRDGSFWLKPGETRHGVTLLAVNHPQDEAWLTVAGQLVRLRLSARTFTPLDFSRLAEAVQALPPTSLLRALVGQAGPQPGGDVIRRIEQSVRELDALYAEIIAGRAPWSDDGAYEARLQTLTPLARDGARSLRTMLAQEKRGAERRARLLALLQTAAAAPAAAKTAPP